GTKEKTLEEATKVKRRQQVCRHAGSVGHGAAVANHASPAVRSPSRDGCWRDRSRTWRGRLNPLSPPREAEERRPCNGHPGKYVPALYSEHAKLARSARVPVRGVLYTQSGD